MARIHYTTLVPDGTLVTKEFPDEMFASKEKASGFEAHDPDGNYLNYVDVHGTGLKYRHGYLVAGTVTDVAFKTGDGENYLTATHVDFKVTEKLDLSSIPTTLLYLLADSGNDKIRGSKESDVIFSSLGNDIIRGSGGDDVLVAGSVGHTRMSGGTGSDTFVITGLSKVVITDFDANGGGTDQDYIYCGGLDQFHPRIYQDHHNTVLDFGSHHTVTLLGVDRADFSLVDDVGPEPPVLHTL